MFDEPLSKLDALLRVDMRVELAKLHKSLKATMIYVTHDQVEAMTLADRVIVLNAGKIAQVGRPMDLYDAPRDLFVAGFIGSPKMNFISGRMATSNKTSQTATICEAADGPPISVKLPKLATKPEANAKITIGVRPEHITFETNRNGTSLEMTVTLAEYLGEETIIYGKLKDGSSIVVKSPNRVSYSDNETIKINLPKDKIHVFNKDGLAAASTVAQRNDDITG